jgi:hypothetical protein
MCRKILNLRQVSWSDGFWSPLKTAADILRQRDTCHPSWLLSPLRPSYHIFLSACPHIIIKAPMH